MVEATFEQAYPIAARAARVRAAAAVVSGAIPVADREDFEQEGLTACWRAPPPNSIRLGHRSGPSLSASLPAGLPHWRAPPGDRLRTYLLATPVPGRSTPRRNSGSSTPTWNDSHPLSVVRIGSWSFCSWNTLRRRPAECWAFPARRCTTRSFVCAARSSRRVSCRTEAGNEHPWHVHRRGEV